MGGYLAIVAAEHLRARAVVAVCPASAEMLRRGLRKTITWMLAWNLVYALSVRYL